MSSLRPGATSSGEICRNLCTMLSRLTAFWKCRAKMSCCKFRNIGLSVVGVSRLLKCFYACLLLGKGRWNTIPVCLYRGQAWAPAGRATLILPCTISHRPRRTTSQPPSAGPHWPDDSQWVELGPYSASHLCRTESRGACSSHSHCSGQQQRSGEGSVASVSRLRTGGWPPAVGTQPPWPASRA